ncbi:MAG: DHH family phosphoesterase [Lachnospiraceae bacterium]|nr:DHH family phosphoesterase [Lachnospiraceae bacterium]
MKTLTNIEKAIMRKRGFVEEKDMLAYLNLRVEDLPLFSMLVDGKKLLDGLNTSIDKKEKITIYGDYDADGVMAMTILFKGLDKLSPGNIRWFANNRFRDGYSITPDTLLHMLAENHDTDVILSCDNGIGAKEAWDEAVKKGIKVFVTDHHEQPSDRVLSPDIPAVCEKSVKQKEEYLRAGKEPEEFCGAELARRLVYELYRIRGIAEDNKAFLNSLCAYSGVATITDVVPLKAGNHCIARCAIETIRKDNGFWRYMYEGISGGNRQREADEDFFGFYLGPSINACSRVNGSVELPMDVFLCDESREEELRLLIDRMNGINLERRNWTDEDLSSCEKFIKENGYSNDDFILVVCDSLREGINGLSAGRLTEKYNVPVIVLGPSENPGIYKGSARSVESINIFEELFECRDLLLAYGGHPKAAGLSVNVDHIDELRSRMKESISKKIVKEEAISSGVDFTLVPSHFTEDYINGINEALEELLPFGEGFSKPGFYMECDIKNIRYLSEGAHAKLELNLRSADNRQMQLMMWNKGDYCRQWCEKNSFRMPHAKGLVGRLNVNEYNGYISYQMNGTRIELV